MTPCQGQKPAPAPFQTAAAVIVIMRNLRCLLGHHWRYGIGPSADHVVLTCRRCHTITIAAAEPAIESISRLADLKTLGHLFDQRGQPR